jgi:HD-GYP domain-containing protein (c-di-GMP phosphodiesterase class II)
MDTFKKHVIIIISLIFIAIFSIILLLFLNLKNSYNDNALIDTLGKQRSVTQIMTKNSLYIYEFKTSINSNSNPSTNTKNYNKVSTAIQELKESRDEFDKQYNSIIKGYVVVDNRTISLKGDLKELEPFIDGSKALWPEFKESIDILIDENSDVGRVNGAMRYIKDNNEKLFMHSNNITNSVIDYYRHRSLTLFYIFLFVAISVLILLTYFFVYDYKNLFEPLSALYKTSSGVNANEANIDNQTLVHPLNGDIIPVKPEVQAIFNRLKGLVVLIENLNKNVPFKEILQYIFDSFSDYIPYTYIGVALIENDRKTIKASYGVTGKYHENLPKRFLGYRAELKNTSLERIVDTGEERVINDLEEYVKGKPLKEYNRILLEEGIRSSITFPLKNNIETVGIIFFSSNKKNVYQKDHIEFLKTLANSITMSLEKDIFVDDMIVSSTLALAVLTEDRDPDTGGHLKRMTIYSKAIAEILSRQDKYKDIIDIEYISSIERFSPLHDIGKVAIRDDILLKPAKLTKEEFEIMKSHTTYGGDVLRQADENLKKKGRSIFKMGIEIAEGHHEKWDGTGYPRGKKGEDIPLSARIVAIADVFDALTSKRPYKRAFTFEESVDILKEGAGKHFDPYIMNVFIENIDEIKMIYNDFKEQNIL